MLEDTPTMISVWKMAASQWEPAVEMPPSSSKGPPGAVGQLRCSETAARTERDVTMFPCLCNLHTSQKLYLRGRGKAIP